MEIKKVELAGLVIKYFEKYFEKLRKNYPVKTICMHGSPLSKYDNILNLNRFAKGKLFRVSYTR